MPRFSRRLIAAASQVQNDNIRTRLLAFSKEVRKLEKRREAEGGAFDRSMTLSDLGPLLKLWATGHQAAPKVIPEPPGMWAKIMFAAGGVPTGSIGKILLTFIGQITKVKPALVKLLMAKNVKGGMQDQAAALQQAEKQWDQLVAPLREYANYEGIPENVRRMIQQAVGQAG